MLPEATQTELHAFVIEKAAEENPARRARLFRALARVSGNKEDAERLHCLALQCDELDGNHQQLLLDFKRRAAK